MFVCVYYYLVMCWVFDWFLFEFFEDLCSSGYCGCCIQICQYYYGGVVGDVLSVGDLVGGECEY